jgi:HSP20 family protein
MSVRPLVPFRTLDAALAADRVLRPARPATGAIALDVVRHDDRVELYFDLPGVRSDDVELTIDKRELVLRAERRFALPEGATMVRAERRQGELARRLLLAENLDTERMHADHAHGVLRVTIPVIEAAQPRRIPVAAADGGQPAVTDAVVNDAVEVGPADAHESGSDLAD